MDFESILNEVGDFGKYQKSLLLKFMVPTTFASALYVLNVIFMVASPDHWCAVPELSSTNLTENQKKLLSIPKFPDGSFSKCSMYDVDYSSMWTEFEASGIMPRPTSSWPAKSCSSGWVFDADRYAETVVSKWNLVCDDNHLPSLVLTLANAGSVVGTFIFSMMADRQGRKDAFLANIAVAAVTGVLSVFSPTFAVFAILRTLTGSTVPSNFQLPYIITVEQVGPKQRARLVCVSWILWTLGACTLALIAYVSHHWATLGLLTTLPITVFYIYDRYLPQSPRLLLAQGRCEEAAKVIEKIAKTNGKEKPRDLLLKLRKISEDAQFEAVSKKEHSFLDLVKYPQLRKKLFIVTLNWSAIAIAYFGLTINATNLGGNDFLNFFLLSAVELPAFPIGLFVMERLGRRWSNTIFVLFTGIACLIPSFLAEDMEGVAIIVSMLGKFGSAAAFMIVYQQAAELYPTPVRALGMGTGSTVSSLAVICMPYVCYLGMYNQAIPFLIIGAFCVSAGLIAPLVPETLNKKLPQTIQDSESFGIGKGCFWCKSADNEKEENTDDDSKI